MYCKKFVIIICCSFFTAMTLCMQGICFEKRQNIRTVRNNINMTPVSSDIRTVECHRMEPRFCIDLSEQELSTMMKIVEAEAGGEDYMGKVLVANVVINRVKSKDFPDDVDKVVYQHDNAIYQFSPVLDGRIGKVEVSSETQKAVYDALLGKDYSKGALYFVAQNAKQNKKEWFVTNLRYLYTYGGHEFYF